MSDLLCKDFNILYNVKGNIPSNMSCIISTGKLSTILKYDNLLDTHGYRRPFIICH